MNRKTANLAGVVAMAILVVIFEIGLMSPANALFGVAVILIGMTTVHFMAFEGRTVGEAFAGMFAWPKLGGGRVAGHLAYFGVSIVGVLIMLQAVTSA